MTNRAGRRRRHRRHKSNARLGPFRSVLIGDGGPLTMMGLAVLMEEPRYQRWRAAKYARPARRGPFAVPADLLTMENPIFADLPLRSPEGPLTYQCETPAPPLPR